MRLGYERIVKDKRIMMSVEESDDPVVTLRFPEREDIRFRASDDTYRVVQDNQSEIEQIIKAVHQAFAEASLIRF